MGLQCAPGPCSDPPGRPPAWTGQHVGPPPKYKVLKRDRNVVFTEVLPTSVVRRQWPQLLVFGVARKGPRKPAPAKVAARNKPQITCTTGQVVSIEPGPAPEYQRDWFRVSISSAPTTKDRRMSAGDYACTVRFPAGNRMRSSEGSLTFSIDEDGMLRL